MDNFPFIRDLFELLDAANGTMVRRDLSSEDPDGFGPCLTDAEDVFE